MNYNDYRPGTVCPGCGHLGTFESPHTTLCPLVNGSMAAPPGASAGPIEPVHKLELFVLPRQADGSQLAVASNPGGRWHGWSFRRHADGYWMSDGRLQIGDIAENGPFVPGTVSPKAVPDRSFDKTTGPTMTSDINLTGNSGTPVELPLRIVQSTPGEKLEPVYFVPDEERGEGFFKSATPADRLRDIARKAAETRFRNLMADELGGRDDRLAEAIRGFYDNSFGGQAAVRAAMKLFEEMSAPVTPPSIVGDNPVDSVVEEVRADLLRRSQLGIKKYGVTLDRTDLTMNGWLQHAYEEALDLANYLKRSMREIP